MSAILDDLAAEEKNLMVMREVLDQLKLIALILEEVHGTGFKIDDIED